MSKRPNTRHDPKRARSIINLPMNEEEITTHASNIGQQVLICVSNSNTAPVEPNLMMRIASVCYISKSDITLEEGIVNQVTIACFHVALCSESSDWMIWMIGLSPPVFCIGCTTHHEHVCTCHFGIPPS